MHLSNPNFPRPFACICPLLLPPLAPPVAGARSSRSSLPPWHSTAHDAWLHARSRTPLDCPFFLAAGCAVQSPGRVVSSACTDASLLDDQPCLPWGLYRLTLSVYVLTQQCYGVGTQAAHPDQEELVRRRRFAYRHTHTDYALVLPVLHILVCV